MGEHLRPTREAVEEVCAGLGLDTTGLTDIRVAANGLWRLPALGVVAKVYPSGYIYEAEASLGIINARWLQRNGVPAVVPWRPDIALAPSSGRPVSFWHDLGEHRGGTPQEMAAALRALRALKAPDGMEKLSDPMPRAYRQIAAFTWITDEDRKALNDHVTRVKQGWRALADDPSIPAWEVSHGCVYPGNLVVPADGEVRVLNVERLRLAPAGYDVVTMASKALVIGQYSPQVYRDFSEAYGCDVTELPWYEAMEAVVRTRAALYAVQVGNHHVEARELARYRMDSLLGRHGEGPWVWPPLPVDTPRSAQPVRA